MSRWGSILRSIFQFGSVGVAIAEATGLSGKEKAGVALAHVIDALALNELEETDPAAAAGVARGIRFINDGIVAVENSVGNLSLKGEAVAEDEPEKELEEVPNAAEPSATDEAIADLSDRVDRAVEAAEKAAKAAERAAAAAEKLAALAAAPKKKGK